MFARKVSLHLKPNAVKDFSKKMESDVIPLLRKQNGFQDEITFTAKDGKKAIGISLWDRQESAEAYERNSYPQVQKLLDLIPSPVNGIALCQGNFTLMTDDLPSVIRHFLPRPSSYQHWRLTLTDAANPDDRCGTSSRKTWTAFRSGWR